MSEADVDTSSEETPPSVGGMPAGWAPDDPVEISPGTGKPKRRYTMVNRKARNPKPIEGNAPPLVTGNGERVPRTKPSRTPGRKSTASMFEGIWSGLGMILTNTGIDPAVGRVLQLESVAAGPAFDNVVNGTVLDRILQPMLGKKSEGQLLISLIGLPLLIGAVERNPAMGAQIEPVAKWALMSMLPTIVASMKDAKKQEAKLSADLAELREPLGVPDGEPVTLDHIFAFIFAPAPNAAPADA